MKNNIDNETRLDIALIGYTQAGKTTLAVGLYASSSPDFTVSGNGEDTENYLQSRKSSLEGGEWLQSTSEGQRPDLCLRIGRGGRPPVEVSFKEYMGERACNLESYKRDVVGDPRGAIILLNPRMKILRDPQKRNEMLGHIKQVINYLSEPGRRCEFVAFAVTASDLLTTSLSDYREEFERYKCEITNYLSNNVKFKKAWKEFAVTVSGRLEDPDRPRIAPGTENTSRNPFVWLIESIESLDRRRRRGCLVKRVATAVASLAVIVGLVSAGWYWWHDRKAEYGLRASLERNGVALESALLKGAMSEVNKICGQMSRDLDAQARQRPYFETNRQRLDSLKKTYLAKYEDARLTWYATSEIDRIAQEVPKDAEQGLSVSEFRDRCDNLDDYQKKFTAFNPVSQELQNRLKEVREQWNAMRANVVATLEDGVGRHFRREMDQHRTQAATSADKDTCRRWRSEIEAWNPLSSKGREICHKTLVEFDAQVNSWRSAYENRRYVEESQTLQKRLDEIAQSAEVGNDVHGALLSCKTYEMNAQREDPENLVEQKTRRNVWEQLKIARGRMLESVKRKKLDRMNVNGEDEPVPSENDTVFLDRIIKDDEVLSQEECAALRESFAEGLRQKKAEWRNVQHSRYAAYTNSLASAFDGYEVAHSKFPNFYSENSRNPFITNAVVATHHRIGDAFDKLKRELYLPYTEEGCALPEGDRMNRVERAFQRLRELCNAVAKIKCPEFRRSCWFRLAQDCLQEGEIEKGFRSAFPVTVAINRIDVQVFYPEANFPYFFDGVEFADAALVGVAWDRGRACMMPVQSNELDGCTATIQKEDNGKWVTVWRGGKSLTVNAWTGGVLRLRVCEKNQAARNVSFDETVVLQVMDGKFMINEHVLERGDYFEDCTEKPWDTTSGNIPTIRYRFYGTGSGKNFFDYWPSNKELTFE